MMTSRQAKKKLGTAVIRRLLLAVAVAAVVIGVAPVAALADGHGVAAGDEGGLLEVEGVVAGAFMAADDEIELFRGRDIGNGARIVTVQDLEGVVSGNVIEGTITTGDVSIAPEAFSHFDGISSVIVNSGNNVSIQSSMVVNVTIEE